MDNARHIIGLVYVSAFAFFFHLFNATAFTWLIFAISYFCIQCLGMTVGYHRLCMHKVAKVPSWFRNLCLFFGTFGLQNSALSWCAVHSAHHRHSDTDKDPHSPMFQDAFTQIFAFETLPLKEVSIRRVPWLLRSNTIGYQHKHYYKIIYGTCALVALIDPYAVVYGILAPGFLSRVMMQVFLATYSHRNGTPHNDTWLGYASLGEGWHMNHHKNVKAISWHKHDLGGMVLKKLEIS